GFSICGLGKTLASHGVVRLKGSVRRTKNEPLRVSFLQAQTIPNLDPTQLRVLVVDDEPMLRSVIEEFLDLMGFSDHFVAGDGEEALDILHDHEIDCLVSDIRMPKMELNELLPILGQEFPGLVVIATSGCNDFDSAYNIFHAGAHDFL